MEQIYLEFNQIVRDQFAVFKAAPSKLLNRVHIDRLQAKMQTGMRAQSEYAITVLGPYFWNARDEIKRSDHEFFLARNYGAEIMDLSRKHGFDYDDAIKTVGFMKEAYRLSDQHTQRVIMQHMQSLLQVYVKFVLAGRVVNT